MQEITGKRITGVFIGQMEGSIKFTFDNADPIVFGLDSDCCSESWFSEIINLDALVGHTVTEVRELQLPALDDGNCRQESDSFYGYGINTDAGYATIVFRNSSNGYYGGSCCPGTPDNVAGAEWTNISHLQDWTAYDTTTSKVDVSGKPLPSHYRVLKCQVLQ
jgi:hypothetical protein